MFGAVRGAVLDAVLPQLCLACSEPIATPGLCAGCWLRIAWIAAPICMCCGTPLEIASETARRCVPCTGTNPVLTRMRAALRYDEQSRSLVLGFKHADRLHAAPSFARWLAAAGEELLVDTDLVIPVPLHWTRLAWRRYNQSAILARLVARAAGLPFLADMLVRRRRTPSQGELGRTARQQNVSGAFALARRHRARVAGKRILLVDDVLTTGATLEACARTLLRAGAQQVDALTLARVVRRTTE